MTKQEFHKKLNQIIKKEPYKRHDFLYGLTSWWVKFLATSAIQEFHVQPQQAYDSAFLYYRHNPKFGHDMVLNHGGSIVDDTVVRSLYDAHVFNWKQFQKYVL